MSIQDLAGTGSVSIGLTGGGHIEGEIRNIIYVPRLPEPDDPPFTSRIHEMPTNPTPTNAGLVGYSWSRWPTLPPADISGCTIHHTMSHSPLAVARYCTELKGLPSIQYHLWVSADDGCPVWQLTPFAWGLWHDHTGTFQTTLSIGVAGRLHEFVPPDEQLRATAILCRWLMREYSFPVDEVRGHVERAPAGTTICPGWHVAEWRDRFYEMLEGD